MSFVSELWVDLQPLGMINSSTPTSRAFLRGGFGSGCPGSHGEEPHRIRVAGQRNLAGGAVCYRITAPVGAFRCLVARLHPVSASQIRYYEMEIPGSIRIGVAPRGTGAACTDRGGGGHSLIDSLHLSPPGIGSRRHSFAIRTARIFKLEKSPCNPGRWFCWRTV